MGAIRTEELSNGNLAVEITYGGKEAPFGGVDTSAPPAYIAPNCFAAADGFLVVDGKLVAASLQPIVMPSNLWNNVAGVSLLAFGTFYNSIYGQLNYAFGYTWVAFGSVGVTATGVTYTFYMTSWSPNDPTNSFNDEISISLYDAASTPGQASLTLDCVASGASSSSTASGATANITAVDASGSITAVTISGGTGYFINQYLNIVQGNTLNALYQVNTVDGSGGILTGTLIEGGLYGFYYVGAANVTPINQATIGLKITGPAGGPNTYTVPALDSPDFSRQGVVAYFVDNINPDPNVTIAASPDGFSLILTSKVSGTSGNSITVQDASINSDAALPPPFYFSCLQARNLEGGELTQSFAAPRGLPNVASTAEVGGTLYIANLGPMILKYSGPGSLTTSTLYNGVEVLKKFAGSLIGLRIKPQLGTVLQNQDMIFAWSAANQLDEWAPLTTAGFVTGAGFAQLADIGDYLAGLVVSSATAFILRSQGISYATATGNSSLPFAFNHIGLGDQGEGAQVSQLVCQYDQTGVYAGGTNIYQLSGSISAIGTKIACTFFSDLESVSIQGFTNLVGAAACAVLLGGSEFPFIALSLGYFDGSEIQLKSYSYNPENGTWMNFTYKKGVGISAINKVMVSPLASLQDYASANAYNQTLMGYAFQQILSSTPQPLYIFTVSEGIPNVNSISNEVAVTFPQEEILFGRDITVDSLYIALNADVSENTFVDFYINNVLYATLTLTAAEFNSVAADTNPIEQQVFATVYGAGATTFHSPQLTCKIRSLTDTGTALVRFTKIMMLASFDPKQRPT